MNAPPFVIAEINPGSIAADFAGQGWTVRQGWQLPDEPWDITPARLICAGVIRTDDDVQAALLVAARGGGLIITPMADRDVFDRFMEDLRHLGPVGVAGAPVSDDRDGTPLADDQLRLLELLSTGMTVAEAADACFLSRRTAERRLAAARRSLGVSTTTEALMRLRNSGR